MSDSGLPPSLAQLAETHRPALLRYARQLTGDADVAEDLVQTAFVRALDAWERLPADAHHRAWLYRIVTNAFLSDRRRARAVPLASVPEPAAADHDHAARMDAAAQLREVGRFVAGLPPKQRAALIQRRFHGLPYAEIASALGCSEAAARASVHEAVRKLDAAFGSHSRPEGATR